LINKNSDNVDGPNEQAKNIFFSSTIQHWFSQSERLSNCFTVDKLTKQNQLILLTCPFCKYPDIPAAATASAAASTACRCSSWGAPLSSLSLGPSLLFARSLLADAAAAVLPWYSSSFRLASESSNDSSPSSSPLPKLLIIND